MSAKIEITVKDVGRFTKEWSKTTGERMKESFTNMLHPLKAMKHELSGGDKAEILIELDKGGRQVLKASAKPYEFIVNAGAHTLAIEDPTKEKKQGNFKVVGATVGFGAGLGLGSSLIGTSMMTESGARAMEDLLNAGEGAVEFELRDHDVLRLQCQPTMTGKVKVKVLK